RSIYDIYASKEEPRANVRERDARPHHPAPCPGRSCPRSRRPGDDVHEAAGEPTDRDPSADRGKLEAANEPRTPGECEPPGRDGPPDQKHTAPPADRAAAASPPSEPAAIEIRRMIAAWACVAADRSTP